MMGGLHPRGSLFERPVNIESARAHHANFRQARAAVPGKGAALPVEHSRACWPMRVAAAGAVCCCGGTPLARRALEPRATRPPTPLHVPPSRRPVLQVLREHGVKVLTVREILAHGVEQHMGARVALERLALEALAYQVGPRGRDPRLRAAHGICNAAMRAPPGQPNDLFEPLFARGATLAQTPNLLASALGAQLAASAGGEQMSEADRFYLSDDYKRQVGRVTKRGRHATGTDGAARLDKECLIGWEQLA